MPAGHHDGTSQRAWKICVRFAAEPNFFGCVVRRLVLQGRRQDAFLFRDPTPSPALAFFTCKWSVRHHGKPPQKGRSQKSCFPLRKPSPLGRNCKEGATKTANRITLQTHAPAILVTISVCLEACHYRRKRLAANNLVGLYQSAPPSKLARPTPKTKIKPFETPGRQDSRSPNIM